MINFFMFQIDNPNGLTFPCKGDINDFLGGLDVLYYSQLILDGPSVSDFDHNMTILVFRGRVSFINEKVN